MDNLAFDLGNFLGGLAAGFITGIIGGSLITLRLTKTQKTSGKGTTVDQSKSNAGGDIVGRDKIN